jgi:predicted NACHT family NTPase
MSKPSLKASPLGIQSAKQALTQAGWTQRDLCAMIPCSRQPITNFFKGSPIAQSLFMQICDRLGLDWQAIADLPALPLPFPTSASPDIQTLVQRLRQNNYANLRERCGTLRVLDMSHPIEVNDLYTHVNILEQITGNRRKRIDELLKNCELEAFDRLGLAQISEASIPGIEAVQTYQKLMILGKPGAGKTTFLKYLAIQCNEGLFEPERLPIFVTLKDFAEAETQPNLLEYISQRDMASNLSVELADWHNLLSQGKALLLLDGLDEVRAEDYHRVVREISEFSEQFWQNHFVITCRIAAWDYAFEKFTEVEVADFNEEQIAVFATQWFQGKPMRATTFLKYLDQHPRIKQLTVSPLLLTLVCLAFEESGDCPSSRSELYKDGVDALLNKWDAKRGIQRDQIYQKLSHRRKEDLLSYLAFTTFKQKSYFFRQSVIEQYIADYIRNLSITLADPEALQLDSEVILRSMEAQHGLLIERAKSIYSFSHLTFHEYFTAREIVFNSPALAATLQEIIPFITDKRWHEIFLLTTEMLRDASLLLLPMKQAIDALLADSPPLQKFLAYVRDRATAPEFASFHPAAVRAFYFDIDFDIDENRTVALAIDRQVNLLVCASFLTRMLDGVSLQDAIAIAHSHDAQVAPPEQIITATSANAVMLTAIKIALDSKQIETDQQQVLKTLLQRLKDPEHKEQGAEQVKAIADKARAVAKKRHHIGQAWQFSPSEKELLKQYYMATELLLECLHTDGCMISPELRQTLENHLLLPAVEASHC